MVIQVMLNTIIKSLDEHAEYVPPQQTNTCSKSTIKTLEKDVKSVQS